MFDFLDDVNPLQLCARTLLFDSWFAFPKVIKCVVFQYPLHVICMLKSMHRVYYILKGKKYTLNQLYKKSEKNAILLRFLPQSLSAFVQMTKVRMSRSALFLYGIEIAPYNGWLSFQRRKKKSFSFMESGGTLNAFSKSPNPLFV